jgi:hypothetical protein
MPKADTKKTNDNPHYLEGVRSGHAVSRKVEIRKIVIDICEPCLSGRGEMCDTPGCALFLHSVDIPIAPEVYQVVHRYEVDLDGDDQ